VTEFDRRYGRAWQCVIGRDFANSVTYDDGYYTAFEITNDKLRVLIFRN
jgi:hypothetical protein